METSHAKNVFLIYIDLIQKRQGMFVALLQKKCMLCYCPKFEFSNGLEKKRRKWNNPCESYLSNGWLMVLLAGGTSLIIYFFFSVNIQVGLEEPQLDKN